jgi:hypothetical protein
LASNKALTTSARSANVKDGVLICSRRRAFAHDDVEEIFPDRAVVRSTTAKGFKRDGMPLISQQDQRRTRLLVQPGESVRSTKEYAGLPVPLWKKPSASSEIVPGSMSR